MVTWVQNIVLFQQIYRTCNNLKGQPSGAWVHEKVISKQVHLNILSICYNKKLLNTLNGNIAEEGKFGLHRVEPVLPPFGMEMCPGIRKQ